MQSIISTFSENGDGVRIYSNIFFKLKWTAEKDDLLIREMFSERPWTKRGGSADRSLSWERIADVLNLLDGFNINQRSVRDRFTHLLNKYKQKRLRHSVFR